MKKRGKFTYVGHLVRRDDTLTLLLDGKINGKRSRGKQREWTGAKCSDCMRKARTEGDGDP